MKKPKSISLSPQASETLLVLLLLLVNLILVSPTLMPDFASINPHDEAKYVESGWLLLHGQIRDLAWAPLVALLYAPIHLFVGASPDWFLLEDWIGRVILVLFISLSLFYLARQLKQHTHPAVVAGILLVSTFLFPILENQSDALYIFFSVLALSKLLAFRNGGRLRDAALASFFTGLAVLCRVEASLLAALLILWVIWIGHRRYKWFRLLAAGLAPTLVMLALYALLSLACMGRVNWGVDYKSYDSFQWNQSILTGGDLKKAYAEADRLFGTKEENGGSVLRAILRNPPAFARRIWANAITQPDSYLIFFGKPRGFALLFFAGLGFYALIRRRSFGVLFLLLSWALPPLVSLGFLARHFIPQTCFLPVILGAIGMNWIFSAEPRPWERRGALAAALLLLLYCLVDHKPGFLTPMLLISAVIAAAWLLRPRLLASQNPALAPLLLLLAAGLILHGPYAFPNYPQLGQSETEKAIHYIEVTQPPHSNLLAPLPVIGIAARVNVLETGLVPSNLKTPAELAGWMVDNQIRAIYVEDRFMIRADVSDLLVAGVGSWFDAGFVSESGQVRVYTLIEP